MPKKTRPEAPRTPEAIQDGMLKCAEIVAKLKPIGIAHHGWATGLLWRAGKLDQIRTFVDKVHDLGIPAGISTHNPVILEALEAKGRPNDEVGENVRLVREIASGGPPRAGS